MKANRSPIDELSKRVFNSERRLSVIQVLLELKEFATVAQVARDSGVASSTVHSELHLLADLGLLQRVTPERKVLFQRLESPFWQWCESLIAGVSPDVEQSRPSAEVDAL